MVQLAVEKASSARGGGLVQGGHNLVRWVVSVDLVSPFCIGWAFVALRWRRHLWVGSWKWIGTFQGGGWVCWSWHDWIYPVHIEG
jgi:hypothetical protein